MKKDSKKKVLFVATVDSHIELFHLPYLKMFKDKGYEVHVATNTDKKIKYCDKKHKISIERNPFKLKNLKAIRELKKVVNVEKFEIIHCHTPMGGVVARLAGKKARKAGTRMIYTAHGFHFYTGAPLKNWLLFYPVEKYLAKYTDTLITINHEDFDRAKKKFGKRCKDIHYVPGVGVDEKKFRKKLSAKQKHDLRKFLGLRDDDFVMIYAAELSKRKNQLWLIEHLSRMMDRDEKTHLLLPGSDSMGGKCQNKAKELGLEKQIHFLGFRQDISELLQISNLAISASKQEGLPVNLIEATAAGLPIIATNCRGNRDIIDNGACGMVVKSDSLSKYIKRYSDGSISIKENMPISNFGSKAIMGVMSEIYDKTKKDGKNALFVHDTRFVRSGKKYYTSNGLTHDYFRNGYLKFFSKITVFGRKEELGNKKLSSFAVSSDNDTNFVCVDDLNVKSLFFGEIKKKLREQVLNADFVIIRLPSFLGIVACRICRKYHKKYLVEVVACHFDCLWNYGKITHKIVAIPMFLINRFEIRKSKNVLYVTKHFLQSRYPNHKRNIGISDVQINILEESTLNRRIKNILAKNTKSKYTIGVIGSLDVGFKGQKTAIKALYKLKNNYKRNVELRLLGPCSKKRKEYWNSLIREYGVEDVVFFDGTLPSGDGVYEWLDEIDFFLMPSLTEGMPRSMIEAMSRGCICIGSNVGGILELLPMDMIVDRNDADRYAELINKFISNKKLVEKYSKKYYNSAKMYENATLNNIRDAFYKEIFQVKANQ